MYSKLVIEILPPSANKKSQSLQVSLKCCPQSWRHPILILGIAVLPRCLLQGLQITISSRSIKSNVE